MFEGWTSDLLASYLGQVLDIQQEQLKINLWTAWKTGISLEDVPLRGDLLDHASVPLRLIQGNIGLLQVQIPWRALRSPIVVSLKDVHLNLGVMGEEDLSSEASEKRYMAVKKAILASQQLQAVAKEVGSEEGGTGGDDKSKGGSMFVSFLKHALSLLLGRLQVYIESVKVTLTDSQRNILGEFLVENMSTVEQVDDFGLDKRMYVLPGSGGNSVLDFADELLRMGSWKNMQLKGIHCVWHHNAPDEKGVVMLESDFDLRMCYHIRSSPSQVLTTVEFKKLEMSISSSAIRSIFNLLENLEWLTVRLKYAHLKPARFCPRLMWRFALDGVLLNLKGPLKASRWKSYRESLHSRRKYILLYRKKLERDSGQLIVQKPYQGTITSQKGDLSGDELDRSILSEVGEKQLKILEYMLPISDILACREAAKQSLLSSHAKQLSNRTLSSNNVFEAYELLDNPGSKSEKKSSWVKIPTLADLEDLFDAVDFDPDQSVNWHGSSLTVLAMVHVPQIILNLRVECDQVEDYEANFYNTAVGFASLVNTKAVGSFRLKGCRVLNGGRSLLDNQRGPGMLVETGFSGTSNSLDISLGEIEMDCIPLDILVLSSFIPALSSDSYWIEMMASAYKIGRKGYATTLASRLHRMRSSYNLNLSTERFQVAFGELCLVCRGVSCETKTRPETLQREQSIYSVLSALNHKSSVQESFLVLDAIEMLEKTLLFNHLQTTISSVCLSCEGVVLLHSSEVIIDTKLNRLLGDCSQPAMKNRIDCSRISSRINQGTTQVLQDIVSKSMPPLGETTSPSSEKIFAPTSILCVNLPCFEIYLLDNHNQNAFLEIKTGEINFQMENSCQALSLNVKVENFSLAILEGCITPLRTCNIWNNEFPFIAKSLKSSSVVFKFSSECLRSPNYYAVRMTDIHLKGLESEPGNFISRSSPDAASFIDLCASIDGDSYVISTSISNMHLGYKTLLRLGCTLLDKNQIQSSSGPSKASVDIILKLNLNDIRCSYIHEHGSYDNIPASYWDYAMAHPRVISMCIDHFNLILPLSEGFRKSTAFHLSLRSFVVDCGMIGQSGRPCLPIICLKGINSSIGSTSDLDFLINIEVLQIASHPSQVALLTGVNRILEQQIRGITAHEIEEVPDLPDVSSATRDTSMPFKIKIILDELNVSILGAMGLSSALSGEGKQVAIQAAPNCGCISWLHFKMFISQPIGHQNNLVNKNYTSGKSESDSEICRSAVSAFGSSRNIETQDESFYTPHDRIKKSNNSLPTSTTLTTTSFVSRYYSMESDAVDSDLANDCEDSEPGDFVPIVINDDFESECFAIASSSTANVEDPAICALECIQNGCRVNLHSLMMKIDLTRASEVFGCISTYITIIKELDRRSSVVESSDTKQLNFVFSFHDVDLGISTRFPGSQFGRKSASDPSLLNEFDSSFDEAIDQTAFLRLEGCMGCELRRAGRRIQIDLHKVLCFLVDITEMKDVQEQESVLGINSLMLSFSNLHNRSIENIGPGVEIIKADFSAKYITIWLREKDIPCLSKLIHTTKNIHSQLIELLDFSDGSTVINSNTEDSATQLTLSAAIESLSVLCIVTTSSEELKSMLELEIDRIAFICANFALPLTTGSASFRIAFKAINLESRNWESLLDPTLFKLKFVLPSSNSDLIDVFPEQGSQTQQIDISITPANFTISESIVRTLSLCLQVFEASMSRKSVFSSIQSLITSFKISNSMEHTLEYWVEDSSCFPSNDEPNGVLFPGEIFYPSDAKAYSFCRAGYPSFTDGVKKDSIVLNRRLDRFIFFRVQGTDSTLIGPVPLTREESKLYEIKFPAGVEEKLAIETTKKFPGSWETTLHSTVKVSNNNPVQLEILFRKNLHGTDVGNILSISPGCNMWLPCRASTGFYSFRPSAMSECQDNLDALYDWSEPTKLTSKFVGNNVENFRIICRRYGHSSYHMVLKKIVDESGSLSLLLSPFLIIRNLLPIPCKVRTRYIMEPVTFNLLPMEDLSLLSWSAYTFEQKISLIPENFMESDVVTLEEFGKMVVFSNDSHPVCASAIEEFCNLSPKIGSHLCDQRVKLKVTVNSESGSCIMAIQTGFWVYNYADIPISFNWIADENALLLEDEVQDLLPDSWIQPLSTARYRLQPSLISMPGTSSVGSFRASSKDFEESFGRGTPTSARSLHAVNMPIPRSMESRNSFGLSALVDSVEKTCSPRNHMGYLGSESVEDGLNSQFTGQSCMLHIGSNWPAALDSVDNEDLIARRKLLSIRVSKNKAPRGFTYWSLPQRVDPRAKFQYISVPIAPQRPQTSEWHDGLEHGIYPMVLKILMGESLLSSAPSKISVAPQYILVNRTGFPLQYKQKGSNIETEISPDGQCAIQWPDSSCPQQVCIRIFEAGWIWSGGFKLERSGDIFVKIRHRDRSITVIIRAEMALSESNGTMTVSFYPSASDFSPYRLENCSLEMMSIRQKGVMEQQDVLRPYCCLNYTWDEPSLPHAVVLECPIGKSLGVFDLEKVEFDKMVTVKSKFEETEVPLRISIRAEGPTRVLSVVDTRYHHSNLPRELQAISDKSFGRLGGMFEIKIKIEEITFSMVQRKQEQFFVSLQRLSGRCLSSASRMLLTVRMRRFQVDNPSPYAIYPVLMVMPAPESLLSAKVTQRMERDFQPLYVSLVLWRKKPAGVLCFQTAEVSLRSFGMYLDHNLVDMMDSVKGTYSAAYLPQHLESQKIAKGIESLHMLSLETMNEIPGEETKKYYFDQLSISPTEISLSFTSSTPSDEAGAVPLLQQVVALADVEDARLWISGLLIKDTLMDRDALSSILERHYKRAFILEMFKLVGAANVFGDPLAIFHHIGLGFWEFMSGPLIGLIESARTFGPKQFILGLLSGTKGLLQNIVFAASNAACKASSAAHKAIVMWGFDGDDGRGLLNRRGSFWLLRQEQSKGGLLGAITKGIIGLVIDPINGAERNGLHGFVSGFRHGALGVIMIPVAELLQMSAATAMSIRRAVAGSYNLGWKRPPRWIDDSGTLLPYDFEDSMGRWILMQLNSQGLWTSRLGPDEYVCCTETKSHYQKRRFILLTQYWIFVVIVSGFSWAPKIVWASRISAIEVVHLMQNSIRITANPSLHKKSMLNIHEPLKGIFCAWEGECLEFGKAEAIYNRIKILQSNLFECRMVLSVFPDL